MESESFGPAGGFRRGSATVISSSVGKPPRRETFADHTAAPRTEHVHVVVLDALTRGEDITDQSDAIDLARGITSRDRHPLGSQWAPEPRTSCPAPPNIRPISAFSANPRWSSDAIPTCIVASPGIAVAPRMRSDETPAPRPFAGYCRAFRLRAREDSRERFALQAGAIPLSGRRSPAATMIARAWGTVRFPRQVVAYDASSQQDFNAPAGCRLWARLFPIRWVAPSNGPPFPEGRGTAS